MTSNNYYAFAHGGSAYSSGYLGQPNVASGFSGHGSVASSYPVAARAPGYDQNYGTHAAVATSYGYPPRAQPGAVAYPTDTNQYSSGNAASSIYPYTTNSSSYTNTYNSVVTNYAATSFYSKPSTAALYHPQAALGQHDSSAVYSSNKQSSWNLKKAIKGNKIKTTPKVPQLHYCEICKISCAGPQTYKEHTEGQRHKKKEAQMKSSNSTALKRGQPVGVSLRCELCDVTCTGNDAYAAHIRGSKHQKVLKLHTKLGKPIPQTDPALVNQRSGSNRVCLPSSGKIKVLGTSKCSFIGGGRLHTAGIQDSHSEMSQVQSDEAKIAKNSQDEQYNQNSSYTSSNDGSLLIDVDKSESQPVGQDYVEEIRSDESKSVSFHCKLCDCRFNDPNAKEMHLKGRRHRLQYKKKVDPNLVVEIKPSMKQRKNHETKNRYFQKQRGVSDHYWNDWCPPPSRNYSYDNRSVGPPPMPHLMPPPSGFTGPGGSMMGGPYRRGHNGNSWDDNHLHQKHSEICPSEAELDEIHNVVMITERALKYVSDKLSEEDSQNAVGETQRKEVIEGQENFTPDKPSPQQLSTDASSDPQSNGGQSSNLDVDRIDEGQNRVLKGLMRIGPLAKNLLLVGDRVLDLVVICAEIPTKEILERVTNHLPKQLETICPTEKFEIAMKVEEASLSVSSINEPRITVNVTFTSPLIRGTNSQTASAEMVKEPSQMLDRQKCLNALAALRHAKWYQARVTNLHPCPMIIRLLRDLCRRLPTWSKLDLWAVELLCERVISSAGEQLNPCEAFRHVLEAIASGLLLPGGAGLLDPCEKEPVDALASLSRQEREDITYSAQHALRLIAFRQIHKILDVPSLQSRTRKRKLESETNENETNELEDSDKKVRKAVTDDGSDETSTMVVKVEESEPCKEAVGGESEQK